VVCTITSNQYFKPDRTRVISMCNVVQLWVIINSPQLMSTSTVACTITSTAYFIPDST